MPNKITPFVKRMRTNGGTIFSFSSAVEDVGININEKNNVVKMSHFALINVPKIDEPDSSTQNVFNVGAIPGAFKYDQGSASIKDGRVLIAESFQNYALNLETNLLNLADYDPTLQNTVSERVFWKWMKETGAIRWDYDPSGYWVEELDADGSAGYNSVVKYTGLITAGNIRQDTFGTFNETYILVPTSHGQTRPYFKQTEDANYFHGMEIPGTENGSVRILGRDDYLQPHPDGLSYNSYYDFIDSSILLQAESGVDWDTSYDASLGGLTPGWWYSAYNVNPSYDRQYLIDSSDYILSEVYTTSLQYKDGGNEINFQRSNVDCLELLWDLDTLKSLFNDSALTYDKMAIEYAINDNFDFNSILLYYSVYNSTEDTLLATNLLGVVFIDAPSGNSSDIGLGAGILIPSLEKIQSTINGFGTAYSFRMNIKTDNMVDDTQALIVDMATSDQLYAEDWNEAFSQLGEAVNILSQNNATISFISDQYVNLANNQTQIKNQIQALTFSVNNISRNIAGPVNNIPMFAGVDADDPLIESSIYMSFGKVGIGITEPDYLLHVNGSAKVDDITIENAIRDTSGNVLLGYGSPLQLGASTNERAISMYVGQNTPALFIDTSGNINFANDASVSGVLYVDTSLYVNGIVVNPNTLSNIIYSGSPASNEIGTAGNLQYDPSYLYVCNSTNIWGRILLENGY